MKIITWPLFVAGALLLSAVLASAQSDIFIESFEGASPNYDSGLVTHTESFSNGSEYWQRVQDSDISLRGENSYSGEDGTYYWAAERTDSILGNGNEEQQMDITGINITGYDSLTFYGLFAADGEDMGSFVFDFDDRFHILYQIDGGGFSNGLWFESKLSDQSLLEDTDFDGLGDGTQLTATFSEFSFAIAGTGSTLDLRLLVTADDGDEEMAFDNLRLTGIASSGAVHGATHRRRGRFGFAPTPPIAPHGGLFLPRPEVVSNCQESLAANQFGSESV